MAKLRAEQKLQKMKGVRFESRDFGGIMLVTEHGEVMHDGEVITAHPTESFIDRLYFEFTLYRDWSYLNQGV